MAQTPKAFKRNLMAGDGPSGEIADLCQELARRYSHTDSYTQRLARSFEAWVGETDDSVQEDSWPLEAMGVRLRRGMSVPGYTTADVRGQLLAVRGTNRAAREKLIRAIGDRAGQTYSGLRRQTATLTGKPYMLVRWDRMEDEWRGREVTSNADRIAFDTSKDDKWHLPRTVHTVLVDSLDGTAHLHTQFLKSAWYGHPHEVGSGAVSLFVCDPHVGMVLVVPTPGLEAWRESRLVLKAVDVLRHDDSLQRLRDRNEIKSVRVYVARFELLGDTTLRTPRVEIVSRRTQLPQPGA